MNMEFNFSVLFKLLQIIFKCAMFEYFFVFYVFNIGEEI